MAGMSENPGRSSVQLSRGAVAEGTHGVSTRRRAAPSPAEQKRRQEWGAKWGKLVGDAINEAMKGAG